MRQASSFLLGCAAEEHKPVWSDWNSGHEGHVTSLDGAGNSPGSRGPQVILMDISYHCTPGLPKCQLLIDSRSRAYCKRPTNIDLRYDYPANSSSVRKSFAGPCASSFLLLFALQQPNTSGWVQSTFHLGLPANTERAQNKQYTVILGLVFYLYLLLV